MSVVDGNLSSELEEHIREHVKFSDRKNQIEKDIGGNLEKISSYFPKSFYTAVGNIVSETGETVMNVSKRVFVAARQGIHQGITAKDLSKEDILLYAKYLSERGVKRLKSLLGICMSAMRLKDSPSEILDSVDIFMNEVQEEAQKRNIDLPNVSITQSGPVTIQYMQPEIKAA